MLVAETQNRHGRNPSEEFECSYLGTLPIESPSEATIGERYESTTTIIKSTEEIFKKSNIVNLKSGDPQPYFEPQDISSLVADPVVQLMSKPQLEKAIADTKKKMVQAAKNMEFLDAARLRDEMYSLQKILDDRVE